jgi:hypothetical protein
MIKISTLNVERFAHDVGSVSDKRDVNEIIHLLWVLLEEVSW